MTVSEEYQALIIEDEQSISNLCKRMLQREGYTVLSVDNGEDAESMVENHKFCLMLVDIRLPKVSGIDFYTWLLKEHPECARHVMFMTGSVMGGDSLNFLENSGRPFLLKPFRPAELKEMIDTMKSQN